MDIDKIRISRPFLHKAEGWLFLNGNVFYEQDLIRMVKRWVKNPQHKDAIINKSRKVLLITAAFDRGQEHHDRHLINLFERLEIDASWKNNFPQNIQNLSIYTMFKEFEEREPWLYQRYTEKQELIKAMKAAYYKRTYNWALEVDHLRREIQAEHPELTLFDLFNYDKIDDNPHFLLINDNKTRSELHLKALYSLRHSPSSTEKCKKIRYLIEHLIYRDDEIFHTLIEMEHFFLEKSGIEKSGLYNEQREDLINRLITSASVFIFGGRVFVLNNRLRFYQLSSVFKDAVGKGTNVYGISAGSICQTNRFSLTFDRSGSASDIFAADFGLGLLQKIRIFPHANDIRYIAQADRDELTFFVLRHQENVVIGLREKSILLSETYRDPVDTKLYKRYSSVGEHPVMVFGERGERVDLSYMDEIFMEGSKFYAGFVQIAKRRDVIVLEKEWRKARKEKILSETFNNSSLSLPTQKKTFQSDTN